MRLLGTAKKARTAIAIVALLGAAMALGPVSNAQAQDFPQLLRFCEGGAAGGQCAGPRGVEVNSSNGHVIVVDSRNARIQEFTAWGEFVKAWGWGVVASGPGNDPQNEVQQLTVNATGGIFKLRYGFSAVQTAAIPFDADAGVVQGALVDAPVVADYDPFLPGDLEVTGPAGGPWTIEFTGRHADTAFGGGNQLEAVGEGLSGGASTATLATLQQGGNYEVCVPAEGDVCRSGSAGARPGQLGAGLNSGDALKGYVSGPEGVALDSAGNVYVVDRANHRVQKYDPEGNFLLMFGGGVNATSGADVCTKADLEGGEACGAGSFGDPGPGEGQFGSWEVGSIPVAGDFIDVAADTVYVGDAGRVQEFGLGGGFEGQIEGGALAGEDVQSLALDPDGDLHLTFAGPLPGLFSKDDIHELGPSGNEIDLVKIANPRGLAVDAAGNLFAIKGNPLSAEVLGFGPSGAALDLTPEEPGIGIGADALIGPETPVGIAASSPPTCGLGGTGLVVANAYYLNSFVNLYGSAPDPDVCPPPARPPTIAAQFATSVDSGGATLKARINPHFWADTRYFVEYGTGKCSEGGCDREQPASPGSLLTSAVTSTELTTAAVFLADLEPGTTYHYRFVAQSGGGGPVSGEERTFRTPLAGAAAAECPNDAFRTGLSARLPDCRAYEMVSPLEKANGDVAQPMFGFAQAATSGERMTFGSLRAFADPQSAPFVSQYLAARESNGWSTESISPPRGVPSFYPVTEGLPSLFGAFTPDLCSGWVRGDTEVTLAPGAPEGAPNLYRRDNCTGGSYELLTSSLPPGFGPIPLETYYFPTIQGFSEDATRSVFRANAALKVTEGGPRPPFVCTAQASTGAISYQWLRDGTPIAGATGRNYTSTSDDDGHSIQCQATDSDAAGASLTTSEVSLVEPLAAIAPPNPGVRSSVTDSELPGTPTISGTPKAGETLTCTPGTWKGSPTFAYQWYRNATEIAGESASTYVPISSDRGKGVQCRTIATNAGGAAVAYSKSIVIEATLPLNVTAPSIAGTPSLGETLTCDPGTWQGSPTLAYQWLRGGANIAGATTSTYLLAAADEGKAIQCRVAAANSDATVAEASSRVVVAPPPGTAPPELTAPPSVSGEAEVGALLTCDPGTWSGSPSFAYRWLRNGANILGATASTYTLAAADLGKAVQCQVTATNAGGAVVAVDGAADGTRYLAPPAPPKAPIITTRANFQLYMSDEEGTLRLVSVLPDGSASSATTSVGTPWSGNFGSATRENDLRGAVSTDGSRVFWSAHGFVGPEDAGSGPGVLYLRLNATEPQSVVSGGECAEVTKACTIAISEAPQSRFFAADPQGDRVIYGVGPTGDLELHEAEIEEEGGQMVANSDPIASGVQGVMGSSEDADRVYFVSTEVLSGSEENSEGDVAQAGGRNLYLYERGVGATFVATLAVVETGEGDDSGNAAPSVIALTPRLRISRVSPDGLHAAFVSTEPLTGYDNADAVSGRPDAEVFVYDAEANGGAGELACASCNPSGARPVGREVWVSSDGGKSRLWVTATLPGWNSHFQPSHALSDDGNRVFFDSYDSLVPGDSNGKADVYQWEAPGSGSCTEADPSFSADNGGCIALISSGEGAEDSEFLDATPNGSDVFFTTQSSLVPQDYGLRDVYDARVGGGFPAPQPPPPGCEGEACQGVTEAPNDPTPASQTFQGQGNVRSEETRPRRCPKGKQRVKRRGETRCVKKRGGKAKRKASKSGRAGR